MTFWRTPLGLCALGAAGLGVALRLWHFAGGRSLWVDEAMLAANLRERSIADLFGVLDYLQSAPIGFMVTSKLVTLALGFSEASLRLLPLLAALATLPLAYWTARAICGRQAAAIALIVFALNEQLVYYAAEFKQYGMDVLFSLLIFAAVPHFLRRGGVAGLWPLAFLGALAPWFSNPSIFVLASVGLVLFGRAALARAWGDMAALALTGLLWLASQGVALYAGGVFGSSLVGSMQNAWAPLFAPFPPTSIRHLAWYPEALFRIGRLWDGAELLVLAIAALGVIGLWLQARIWCALLLAPLLLAGAASALHLYPFGYRFLVFATPMLSIAIGVGIVFLVRPLPRFRAVTGLVLVGLLLLPGLTSMAGRVLKQPPFGHEVVGPMLPIIERQRRPGDRIHVGYGALPIFGFYAAETPLRDMPMTVSRAPDESWDFVAADALALSGKGRVWVVLAHEGVGRPGSETLVTYFYDKVGKRLREWDFIGSRLLLYDFGDAKVDTIVIDGKGLPPYRPPHLGFRARPHIPYLDLPGAR